jgi:hypothetical protein
MRRRRRIQVDGHRADAAALLARSPNEPYTLPVRLPQVPAALGVTMLDLAHESNVPLRYVTVALLCYGVEMLAKELRATSHAPYPRIPSSEKPPGA